MRGIVLFQPICWTNKQFALWAELTGYRRNPISPVCWLDQTFSTDLSNLYEKEHGVIIGNQDWSTTLILLGIPFAKDTLTVVAPEDYAVDPVVKQKANAYGVEVCMVPLSAFPQWERDRLAINHMAPAIVIEPTSIFEESFEKAIGERQTDLREMVPEECLNFGEFSG